LKYATRKVDFSAEGGILICMGKLKAEFVVFDGDAVEITMKLNEVLDALQEAGAEIRDVKVNYTKEHGFDGFLVAYTIFYEPPKEMELDA